MFFSLKQWQSSIGDDDAQYLPTQWPSPSFNWIQSGDLILLSKQKNRRGSLRSHVVELSSLTAWVDRTASRGIWMGRIISVSQHHYSSPSVQMLADSCSAPKEGPYGLNKSTEVARPMDLARTNCNHNGMVRWIINPTEPKIGPNWPGGSPDWLRSI